MSSRRTWIWLGVWLCSRALIVVKIGRLEDVANYERWAHILTAQGEFPGGHGWQYPPGAGLLMLVPRLFPVGYGEAWVGLMLAVDLVGFVLLAGFARRSGKDTGVWVWLLGIPLLGVVPLLRFDLVPTVIAIGALLVIHRRPGWFGALAGFGAAIKLWPLLVLFGEWDRRRLLRAALTAVAVIALVLAASAIAFGGATHFVANGDGRGLQEEAVATAPWQVARILSGNPYAREVRFGAWEIVGSGAGDVTDLLKVLAVVALAGAAAWWWYRGRAIGAGREDLADATVSRDFVFAVVLLVVVTSPVLSTQYMVWLLGLAAVVLTSATRLRRPAWIVVGASVLMAVLSRSPEMILLRNLALLGASADAAVTMVRLLRPHRSPSAVGAARVG